MLSSGKRNQSIFPKSFLFSITLVLAMVIGMTGCQQQQHPATLTEQPSDVNIRMALENKLENAHGIPQATEISVEVENGIVTYFGAIDNMLAKERATRIAESITGVRSVINNLSVTSERPDQAIQTDVQDALNEDPATEDLDVQVQVQNGQVTLSGEVDSHQEQELAETVVKGVKGVVALHDSINVDFALDRSARDIKTDVLSALRWDTRIDPELINISVEDNVVSLSGTVGSAHEKTLALQKSWVAGVKSVDAGELEVKSWKKGDIQQVGTQVEVTDSNVESAIRAALEVAPRVKAGSIGIEVVNGHVTLAGTVDNLKASRSAAQVARNTRGVRSVSNAIKVGPVVDITDEKIMKETRSAIVRDPYLEQEDINVAVKDGIVELSGTAATYFEKWETGDIAAKVDGVLEIENKIDVEYPKQRYGQTFYDWDPVLHDFDYEPQQKSDQQLLEDVKYHLSWNPFIQAEDLEISVSDGVVTIDGEVDSWYKANMTIGEAYEAGATYVDSKLKFTDIPTF